MQSKSIQYGQTEIGIVSHDGHEFASLGASVQGSHVTGYLKKTGRHSDYYSLTRFNGSTMLQCRSDYVETYNLEDGKTLAVVFHLTGGRFIVGYALGTGMLFRGELYDLSSTHHEERTAEARRLACTISEDMIALDDEDRIQFEYECSLED